MSRWRERFRSWSGYARCTPSAVHRPSSEEEVRDLVRRAAAAGERVKAVGSGHSWSGLALTDGHHVRLDRLDRVLAADAGTGVVTVEAGITLRRLSAELAARGLALENMGDVAYQTLAGALGTGTHGTGATLGGLATQVRGLRMVLADGSVLDCSADREPEAFAVARVALGVLGVLTQVTLQCVPAFRLRAVEAGDSIDRVLDRLADDVDANRHYEFFWLPHTRVALTKANNPTTAPVDRGALRRWRDEVLFENVAFGALCRLGSARPALVPRLATAIPGGGSTYVDRSDRVFTTPRLVRFTEMEYAVPRAAAAEAFRRVVDWVERSGERVSFPVECRFSAADDVPLSTASGRDTAYVAVHMYARDDHRRYFAAVESIMDSYDGRPHWGKVHSLTAESLRGRYPEWDRFADLRARLDPSATFASPYTDRLLAAGSRARRVG